MKRKFVSVVAATSFVALTLPAVVTAQTNDNDYTPLNSRIRHDRQFPLEPPPHFVPPERMDKVTRDRAKSMESQFSKCLYHRSMEDSLKLLAKTDFGFSDFKQINLDPQRAMRIYGFDDCLGRVADTNNTSVAMRFYPANLRQWLIQAAYLEQYPKAPTWLKPGYVIAQREYPLSKGNPAVAMPMDFADCVVAADPYNADFFFRTTANSADEQQAVNALAPSLGPCLPEGLRIQLQPAMLRTWLGEALWHAANHSAPAPSDSPSKAQ